MADRGRKSPVAVTVVARLSEQNGQGVATERDDPVMERTPGTMIAGLFRVDRSSTPLPMRSPVPLMLLVPLWMHMPSEAASSFFTPMVQLLEEGRVTLSAEGLGDHGGECVKVTVQNRSGGRVTTSIPVGWRLVSVTPEVQDLLVVREELLAVAGGASVSVVCRAFCCEASGTGPTAGERYRGGHQASEALTRVAQAIASDNHPDDAAQHAIWVLSDGHSIAGMGAMDSSRVDSLRLVVSRLSGQQPPRYSMRFAEEPGRVCSGRPEAISRALVYDVPAGTVFHAVVVDRQGRVLQVLEDHAWLEPGRHRMAFDVVVLGWPPGTYAIHAWSTDRAGVHRLPFTI